MILLSGGAAVKGNETVGIEECTRLVSGNEPAKEGKDSGGVSCGDELISDLA